jgi:predicted secreted protein
MKRMFAAALLLIGLLSNPALAGDTAELNILGFSADGNVFAFEEYGVQDGSGFPMPTASTSTRQPTNSCPARRSASAWTMRPLR